MDALRMGTSVMPKSMLPIKISATLSSGDPLFISCVKTPCVILAFKQDSASVRCRSVIVNISLCLAVRWAADMDSTQ